MFYVMVSSTRRMEEKGREFSPASLFRGMEDFGIGKVVSEKAEVSPTNHYQGKASLISSEFGEYAVWS